MTLPVFSAFEPSALAERTNETIDHIVFSVHTSEAMRAAFTRAGQFVKMRVADAAGRSHEGIFAIATAPFEPTIAFLARTNNPAGGEVADRIARMPLDAPIEVTLPAGDGFELERARGRDLAFVAVGTALAPVRSALETVLHEREAFGAITLDYGLRSLAHLPFANDVERWRRLGVDVALHVGETHGDGSRPECPASRADTIVSGPLCGPLRSRSHDGARAQDALFDRLGARAVETAIVAVGHDALVREVRARHAALGAPPELLLHNY